MGARTPPVLLVLMGAWGYVSGIHGSVAPFVAKSFELSGTGLARLWLGIGVASLASLALGRLADHVGRRRVLLACFAAMPLAAGVAALAPGPSVYVLGQGLAFAAGATLLGVGTVAIAEALPEGARAPAQGRAGLDLTGASALPLAVVGLGAGLATPWRLVWAGAGLWLLALPWARGNLVEAEGVARIQRRSEAAPRWRELVRRDRVPRLLPALAAVLLVQTAEISVRAWLLHHPVRALGLPVPLAIGVLVAGGGLGLVGFRLGGQLAERIGRRPTFALAGALFATSAVAYYEGSLLVSGGTQLTLLIVSMVGLSVGGNAALTAFRSLIVELFPAARRGDAGGLLGLGHGLGWIFSMALASWLAAPLGGVGPATAAWVGIALPAAVAVLTLLPETAGCVLDPEKPDEDLVRC